MLGNPLIFWIMILQLWDNDLTYRPRACFYTHSSKDSWTTAASYFKGTFLCSG